MPQQYVCYNENFLPDTESFLSHKNRAFCYGDALFETIRCLGTEPLFFTGHWERMIKGMQFLKMDWEGCFTRDILQKSIGKLLNKNRIFKGARIRLTVFRDEGGLYTPASNKVSWVMESSVLEHEKYELNKKGLHVDLFDGVLKPATTISNHKTANSLVSVLAGIHRKEQGLDECLLLNQYGRIAESISSNVFVVTEEEIITPPLTEGCLAGTMRNTIMQLAQGSGYTIKEKPILEKNLLDAEEVFITNAIQGIQWVGAYRDKRYFNFVARKLVVNLNNRAFNMQ